MTLPPLFPCFLGNVESPNLSFFVLPDECLLPVILSRFASRIPFPFERSKGLSHRFFVFTCREIIFPLSFMEFVGNSGASFLSFASWPVSPSAPILTLWGDEPACTLVWSPTFFFFSPSDFSAARHEWIAYSSLEVLLRCFGALSCCIALVCYCPLIPDFPLPWFESCSCPTFSL